MGTTSAPEAPVLVELTLTVNGEERSLTIDTRTSLLDLVLRALHTPTAEE